MWPSGATGKLYMQTDVNKIALIFPVPVLRVNVSLFIGNSYITEITFDNSLVFNLLRCTCLIFICETII